MQGGNISSVKLKQIKIVGLKPTQARFDIPLDRFPVLRVINLDVIRVLDVVASTFRSEVVIVATRR